MVIIIKNFHNYFSYENCKGYKMTLIIRLKNKIPPKYRFLGFSILVTLIISTLITAQTFNRLIDAKSDLAKDIQLCLKESANQHKGKLVCDVDTLTELEENLNEKPEQIPAFVDDADLADYEQFKAEQKYSKNIQHLITKDYRNYKTQIASIKEIYSFSILIGLLIGLLPLMWVFFLNRLAEIANAIRGNKK